MTSRVHVGSPKPEAGQAVGSYVASVAAQAVATRGTFSVAISGGSLPKILAAGLTSLGDGAVEWDKWHVFYVDERCVPLDHDDSNHLGASGALYEHVDIPAEQIHTINPDAGSPQAMADGKSPSGSGGTALRSRGAGRRKRMRRRTRWRRRRGGSRRWTRRCRMRVCWGGGLG